jgi:PBP1b-binding outer membrane lipoprotein LpoB
MKVKLLLTVLFISFAFTGCKNNFDAFKEMAAGFAQSDKHINREELDKLKAKLLYTMMRGILRSFIPPMLSMKTNLLDFLKMKGSM